MLLPSVPTLEPMPALDWLLGAKYPAQIVRTDNEVVLTNGLVERRLRISPYVSSTSFRRIDTGQEFLRSVEPEGKLVIDGKEILIGGSTSPPNRAYLLDEWVAQLKPANNAMSLASVELCSVDKPIPYQPQTGQSWPPKGKGVLLTFKSTNLEAKVRLEIYDNLPVIGKQISLKNIGTNVVRVDKFSSERLSIVEGESSVDMINRWRLPNVTVATSMAFGGMTVEGANRAVHWEIDPGFETQVNYEKQTPCVLDVHPPTGPGFDLAPGKTLDSLRSYVLLHDTEERDRRSRSVRTMFRKLAPWVEDNPLILHIRTVEDKAVREAIDQAAECGFELVILSFGSGLDMEDTSPATIAKYRALNDYAEANGLRLGGYSLLASRRIDDENDVINPTTGKIGGAIFGNSPCLCSKWGIGYFERVQKFLEGTGFRVLEHDGSYPGDVCASTKHPGHRDLSDSQWKQYARIEEFYSWCRNRDIYLNVPDYYFLAGSNKTGMGYRETNWSLPRNQQHLHSRQNLFDGTYDKAPSMGWMFVPLVEYQGGGAAATIEPLKEHLTDYELHFANTLGYGAQACWRGLRLYDAPETKAMVQRMVAWFKRYRQILESDVVHLRRPDGRQLDYVLHANPNLKEKAILVVYNPTAAPRTESITVPLYYAGNPASVRVREKEAKSKVLKSKNGAVSFSTTVPAQGWTYFVME